MKTFGHNLGYIDELFRRYREDPTQVSEAWREFFKDYAGDPGTSQAADPTPAPPRPASAAPPATGTPPADAVPLRGATARIVENMAASLGVPTATSARAVPVKLLDENRRIVNQHQALVWGPKVSFTHLIAWAVVRALEHHPRMNARYLDVAGRPHRVDRTAIRLGLAVDLERNGERVLVVPNVKDAERLDFPAFVAAYDDLIARAREGRLGVGDFEGTTVTLTNPGMLGTSLSVPRLMEGQGTIVGVGAIGLPAEFSGMSPDVVSELGISSVMTVTSTYDHRVIQGAESGEFLLRIERLLQGDEAFYLRIFRELGVPREPMEWSGDRNPQRLGSAATTEAIAKQAGVLQLIRAYRVRGHLWAHLDPLAYAPEPHADLELGTYGLTVWDLDRPFIAGGLGGHQGTLKLREILDTLQRTYCRHVGVEYMHIQDTASRHWLQERLEGPESREPLPPHEKARILERLNAAEAFETFLHSSYVGQKRFSLEGAETLIPMLDALLTDAADAGVEEVVMGLAHRGRLNVLAHVVSKEYGKIFREFEEIDPQTTHGSGDVKYHLGAEGAVETANGRTVRVRVASNPSHLEAVNPVVEGMVRARQDGRGDTARERVLPVLIHGDAAFAGQGVVAETLNLSQLKGYRTGGTVHIVVNNQIGFTTGPSDARSSWYPTDVAKMVRAPIFHVNGDQPEDAVRVMRDAFAFRARFHHDVVVDLFCYRRWGHNEADDPSYTHPLLYEKIQRHRSVRKLYTEQLLRRGDLDVEAAERALEDFRGRMREVQEAVRGEKAAPARGAAAKRAPRAETPVAAIEPLDGAVAERVVAALDRTPPGFRPHPKLQKQLECRREAFRADRVDWSLAEALAFGSLVLEGVPVRLSGEDSGRGTFSQRHAILYDHRSAEPHTPLAHLDPAQAPFAAYDSLLSEFAVLGFEYGYSVAHPEALVLWEAQFGDFANGAQVIIDQFVASAEWKWGQRSGVVLLLPHGHEGQGPEHSSARLERFLQLCADDNLVVAVPSTPAQYFHLLRAQARRDPRRPLVVLSPKSLLRDPACTSNRAELLEGGFAEVLAHGAERASVARRLIFCTGKVRYDLERAEGRERADIVTVEQLYPFPSAGIARCLERHREVGDVVWVQEEPRNMGAWGFVETPLRELLLPGQSLRYVGRPCSASTATGSSARHRAEQQAIVAAALSEPVEDRSDFEARVTVP